MSDDKLVIIDVDVFDLDIAVFHDGKEREDFLKAAGVIEPTSASASEDLLGFAARDITRDGGYRYSLFLPKGAGLETLAHESSHLADFICEAVGVPISFENTEVRAYLVGFIFSETLKRCGWL